MADADPPEETERVQPRLRRISSRMASIQKTAWGKGPISTRSYLFDDMLLIVMRDGLTVAEKTMLDFGQADLVRNFRQQFENDMTERIVGMIEELTERKVLTYQSQIMFNPHVVVEMFVFDGSTTGGFVRAEVQEGEEEEST
jgi:uncharacterized protein YbcI